MDATLALSASAFEVGLVQMSCGDSVSENHDAAVAGIHNAVARGAQIVCLQELFSTPYFCQSQDPARFDLAEEIPGPTTNKFVELARTLNIVLVLPVFERRTVGIFHNSAVVIDRTGEILGVYRKTHIPDDPQFFEKYYFTPGDLGYRVFETSVARIGVLICWDQWYPEAARLTALAGAEVLFYPTAIGWIQTDRNADGVVQQDAWQTVQRSHAITNGVYVAAVNRVGLEYDNANGDSGGVQFWGRSFVCDPRGRVIVEAGSNDPQVINATCSRMEIEEYRRNWPFLRDRRVDTYERLTERYIDVVNGTSGYRSR